MRLFFLKSRPVSFGRQTGYKPIPARHTISGCEPGQKWRDWFISTTPDGFYNIIASLAGLRVPHVKCFCLCGGFNEDVATAFAIGSSKIFDITVPDGELSFFPNDAKGAYKNNKGSITINIKRLQ